MISFNDVSNVVLFDIELNSFNGSFRDVVGQNLRDLRISSLRCTYNSFRNEKAEYGRPAWFEAKVLAS